MFMLIFSLIFGAIQSVHAAPAHLIERGSTFSFSNELMQEFNKNNWQDVYIQNGKILDKSKLKKDTYCMVWTSKSEPTVNRRISDISYYSGPFPSHLSSDFNRTSKIILTSYDTDNIANRVDIECERFSGLEFSTEDLLASLKSHVTFNFILSSYDGPLVNFSVGGERTFTLQQDLEFGEVYGPSLCLVDGKKEEHGKLCFDGAVYNGPIKYSAGQKFTISPKPYVVNLKHDHDWPKGEFTYSIVHLSSPSASRSSRMFFYSDRNREMSFEEIKQHSDSIFKFD